MNAIRTKERIAEDRALIARTLNSFINKTVGALVGTVNGVSFDALIKEQQDVLAPLPPAPCEIAWTYINGPEYKGVNALYLISCEVRDDEDYWFTFVNERGVKSEMRMLDALKHYGTGISENTKSLARVLVELVEQQGDHQ